MLEALTDDVDIVVTTWNPDETEVRERLSSRIFHRIFSADHRRAAAPQPRHVPPLHP